MRFFLRFRIWLRRSSTVCNCIPFIFASTLLVLRLLREEAAKAF